MCRWSQSLSWTDLQHPALALTSRVSRSLEYLAHFPKALVNRQNSDKGAAIFDVHCVALHQLYQACYIVRTTILV